MIEARSFNTFLYRTLEEEGRGYRSQGSSASTSVGLFYVLSLGLLQILYCEPSSKPTHLSAMLVPGCQEKPGPLGNSCNAAIYSYNKCDIQQMRYITRHQEPQGDRLTDSQRISDDKCGAKVLVASLPLSFLSIILCCFNYRLWMVIVRKRAGRLQKCL